MQMAIANSGEYPEGGIMVRERLAREIHMDIIKYLNSPFCEAIP